MLDNLRWRRKRHSVWISVAWHYGMNRLILNSLRPMPVASYQWSSAVRIVPLGSSILATPLRLRHLSCLALRLELLARTLSSNFGLELSYLPGFDLEPGD